MSQAPCTYTIAWMNDAMSSVHCAVRGTWDWDVVDTMYQTAIRQMDEGPAPWFGLIFDISEVVDPPKFPMRQAFRYARSWHPDLVVVVFVGVPTAYTEVKQRMDSMFPNLRSQVHFSATVVRAADLIETRLATYKPPTERL